MSQQNQEMEAVKGAQQMMIKQILSESDAFINKNLEGIQDQDFRSLFQLPPEKVPNVLSSCQFGQLIYILLILVHLFISPFRC